MTSFVTQDSRSALNDDLPGVFSDLTHLDRTLAVLSETTWVFGNRCQRQQLIHVLADRFIHRPTIETFCPPIPEQNVVLAIAYHDGVVRLIEHDCLRAQKLCQQPAIRSFSLSNALNAA